MLLIEAFDPELAFEAFHEAVLRRHAGRRCHGNLDIGVGALACELDLLLHAEDRIAQADQLLALVGPRDLPQGLERGDRGGCVTALLRASHGWLRPPDRPGSGMVNRDGSDIESLEVAKGFSARSG